MSLPDKTPEEVSLSSKVILSSNLNDPKTQPFLEIQLLSATNLLAKDFTGKSDPYVIFTCVGDFIKSSTKYQTLQPKWNETLLLSFPHESLKLEIDVWDWDPMPKHDHIGSVSIAIELLEKNRIYEYCENLTGRDGKHAGQLTFRIIPRNKVVNISLLHLYGLDQSGKSTFFKNFHLKCLSSEAANKELNPLTCTVAEALISITESLIKNVKRVQPENSFYFEFLKIVISVDGFYLVATELMSFPSVLRGIFALWKDPAFVDASTKLSVDTMYYLDAFKYLFTCKDQDALLCIERLTLIEAQLGLLINSIVGKSSSQHFEDKFRDFLKLVPNAEKLDETCSLWLKESQDTRLYPVLRFYILNHERFPPLATDGAKEFDPPTIYRLYCSRSTAGVHQSFSCFKRDKLNVGLCDVPGTSSGQKKWKMCKNNAYSCRFKE